MITASTEDIWVSRLRTGDFDDEMGFAGSVANEVPHVGGLPVRIPHGLGSTVIREWPNLAGRLEPADEGEIVRWCRSLAPEPPQGTVVLRGEAVHAQLLSEMRQWFTKFVRRLTQMPGVSVATPTETARAILLTPGGLRRGVDTPRGVEAVPTRLAEFPGGVVLTMDPRSFERRTEYADAVEASISKG